MTPEDDVESASCSALRGAGRGAASTVLWRCRCIVWTTRGPGSGGSRCVRESQGSRSVSNLPFSVPGEGHPWEVKNLARFRSID